MAWRTKSLVLPSVGAALVLGVIIQAGRGPTSQQSQAPQSALPRGAPYRGLHGKPFLGAVRTTLSRLKSQAALAIVLPDDPLASSSNLVSLWESTTDNEVVADYASGVQVYLKDALPGDPASTFSTIADQIGGPPNASEQTIGQGPALVILQNLAGQSNQGVVEFELDGWDVVVYGYYSSDDLIRVADSVGPI
jgi:hypothetical protein